MSSITGVSAKSLANVPDEIKVRISKFLSLKGLCRYALLNKEFKGIALDHILWKKLLEGDFPKYTPRDPEKSPYHIQYGQLYELRPIEPLMNAFGGPNAFLDLPSCSPFATPKPSPSTSPTKGERHNRTSFPPLSKTISDPDNIKVCLRIRRRTSPTPEVHEIRPDKRDPKKCRDHMKGLPPELDCIKSCQKLGTDIQRIISGQDRTFTLAND